MNTQGTPYNELKVGDKVICVAMGSDSSEFDNSNRKWVKRVVLGETYTITEINRRPLTSAIVSIRLADVVDLKGRPNGGDTVTNGYQWWLYEDNGWKWRKRLEYELPDELFTIEV